MLDLCLTVVLALHLLCVSVGSAGPLVCVWLEWRESRRGDVSAGLVGRWLGKTSLGLLVAGGVLGLLAGWLLWTTGQTRFFDVLVRLPSKISYGIGELVFYLACMWGYLAWWRYGRRRGIWQQVGHRLLAVLAATNALYHFPPLFAVISKIAASGDNHHDVIDAAVFRAYLTDGEVVSRTLHFWLASLAISGVAVMAGAIWMTRRGVPEVDARRLAAGGGRIALIPTLLQLPIGVWVLAQLPPAARDRLIGDVGLGLLLFAASLIAAFALMHQLAEAAMGEARRQTVVRSVALMFLVVLLMTGTLQSSRGRDFQRDEQIPSRKAAAEPARRPSQPVPPEPRSTAKPTSGEDGH